MEQIEAAKKENLNMNMEHQVFENQVLSVSERNLGTGQYFKPIVFTLGFGNLMILSQRYGYTNHKLFFFGSILFLFPFTHLVSKYAFGDKETRQKALNDDHLLASIQYLRKYS